MDADSLLMGEATWLVASLKVDGWLVEDDRAQKEEDKWAGGSGIFPVY